MRDRICFGWLWLGSNKDNDYLQIYIKIIVVVIIVVVIVVIVVFVVVDDGS